MRSGKNTPAAAFEGVTLLYVLARREGDSIVIADLIEVKVLSVNGKIVRLGVNAPREIGVERKDATPPPDRKETR